MASLLTRSNPCRQHTALPGISNELSTYEPLSCPPTVLSISEYPKAFDPDSRARREPYSTTIDHCLNRQDIEHVPIYSPQPTFFSPTAQYILIGGLGGLGRFLCTWMVEHGAKNLNVISRSGLASSEAQSTHAAITKTGASLQAFAADACDRASVRTFVASIRKKGPIQGIVNLAMILGDAPMASMTGEEWDRALRLKIDSSWILHEETMDDDSSYSQVSRVCAGITIRGVMMLLIRF